MKSSEVLRRYAAGERDFRRANLRGQSFKGQDLSGADFGEADIRSTNFADAILKSTAFTHAIGGLQRRWVMGVMTGIFLLSALSGVFSAFAGLFVALIFDFGHLGNQTAGWISLAILVVFHVLIFRRGLTTVAVAVAITAAVGVITAVASIFTVAEAVKIAAAVVLAIASVVATAIATGTAAVVVGTAAIAAALISAVVAGAMTAFIGADAIATSFMFAPEFAAGFAVVVMLLSAYFGWRALTSNDRDVWVLSIAIAVAATGATSFYGADLTDANFTDAQVKSADFRKSILIRTCWKGAKHLNRVRSGETYLSVAKIQQLLVIGNGYKKSYIDAKLRGANLNQVNLNEANLKWADLSEATLRKADLRGADLTETLVLGTDFRGACLTGACLEGWNIDQTTNLEDVDCQYVYLLRNQQERRPSSGDFAPGEFTKLFQEVLSTVDLIFRNGVDWKAFVTAFKQVQVENEDTPLEIQSIENKGDGVVVVRVSAPPETNKEKIHSEFNQQYELALKALESKYRAELQARDGEIAIYREQSANMWEVIKLQARQEINVQAIAEAKAMNDSTDQSQSFNVGGDFKIDATNSVVNLRDINGTVSNAIAQIPNPVNSDQPSLKDLLTQLQQAITTDTDLPDKGKAAALEQVNVLAEVAQNPDHPEKKTLGSQAITFLKGAASFLPDTAKLAEACAKLLPIITSLLGL